MPKQETFNHTPDKSIATGDKPSSSKRSTNKIPRIAAAGIAATIAGTEVASAASPSLSQAHETDRSHTQVVNTEDFTNPNFVIPNEGPMNPERPQQQEKRTFEVTPFILTEAEANILTQELTGSTLENAQEGAFIYNQLSLNEAGELEGLLDFGTDSHINQIIQGSARVLITNALGSGNQVDFGIVFKHEGDQIIASPFITVPEGSNPFVSADLPQGLNPRSTIVFTPEGTPRYINQTGGEGHSVDIVNFTQELADFFSQYTVDGQRITGPAIGSWVLMERDAEGRPTVILDSGDTAITFNQDIQNSIPSTPAPETLVLASFDSEGTQGGEASVENLRNLNEPLITNAEVASREYDQELGGYSREADGREFVYRENILGDAVVMDSFESQRFGAITLETPETWMGRNFTQQHNLEWSQKARENLDAGMTQFYLTAYQRAFDVSPEEAQAMLDRDEPIPWTGIIDSYSWRINGMNDENSWTGRMVVPSQGVSFLLLDESYVHVYDGPSAVPSLTTAFLSGEEARAGYAYGSEVTENGRLVITAYRGGDTGIDKTNILLFAVIDTLRFAGEGARPDVDPAFQRDIFSAPDWYLDVNEALGMRRLGESDYSDITDWDTFSLINVR